MSWSSHQSTQQQRTDTGMWSTSAAGSVIFPWQVTSISPWSTCLTVSSVGRIIMGKHVNLAGHSFILRSVKMKNVVTYWSCYDHYNVHHLQDQRVSLGDRHWHTRGDCFKCGVCRVSLVGGKMCVRQGTPLCSSVCAATFTQNSTLQSPASGYNSSSSGDSGLVMNDGLGKLNLANISQKKHHRPVISYSTIVWINVRRGAYLEF